MLYFTIVTNILAIIGIVELLLRFYNFCQESIFLSLKNPTKVLRWQEIQITKASYLAGKKLYYLSKQSPDPIIREKAVPVSKEYYEIRKRMYENIKRAGFNSEEFQALAKSANNLLENYLKSLSEIGDKK